MEVLSGADILWNCQKPLCFNMNVCIYLFIYSYTGQASIKNKTDKSTV